MKSTNGYSGAQHGEARNEPVGASGWKLLAPLPDPVGYGGMFAGVLGGRLFAGGGSQFRDKPVWLKGEKIFSNRIFSLTSPESDWVEHTTRLPMRLGHAAGAASNDAIYFAGGLDADGSLRQAWAMRVNGNGFTFNRLPDLPGTLAYASATVLDGRLYVIGGQHAITVRELSAEIWSLDLRTDTAGNGWRREADLPETGAFLTAAGAHGACLYVFGGVSFDAGGKAVQSAKAWRLEPRQRRWERLADMPEPRVGAATPCALLEGTRFLVAGGYAKSFPGTPRDHPGFDTGTFVYDVARDAWSAGPPLPTTAVVDRDSPGDPGPSPMVAAPGVLWQDHLVVISGEVRASVRSPAVVAWSVDRPPPVR